jgi:hypothetical protein
MEAETQDTRLESPITETHAQAPVTEDASSQPVQDELDFFDEAVSEAQLRGETPSEEAHGQEEAETPAPKEPQGNEESEGAEEKPADAAKPPKGFVPHAALTEERAKRKEAQRRVERLERELAARTKDVAEEPLPEAPEGVSGAVRRFAAENPQYAALAFEDSPDGRLLRDKLDTYGEEDAVVLAKTLRVERELAERKRREEGAADDAYLTTCVREMSAMFEDGLDGRQARELVGYLQEEAGLNPDTITLLTSPNTVIIDPRTGRRSYLGGRALELVGLFREAYALAAASGPERIREAIEAEVTRKVMQKFNGEEPAFRELGDAPGHGEAPVRAIPATEEAFARLSPEAQERLLRGEL